MRIPSLQFLYGVITPQVKYDSYIKSYDVIDHVDFYLVGFY